MALRLADVPAGSGDLGLFQGLDFWRSGKVTRVYVWLYPWRVSPAFDAGDGEDRHYNYGDADQPMDVASFADPGSRAPVTLVGNGALLVRDRDPAGAEPGKQQLVYLFSVLGWG